MAKFRKGDRVRVISLQIEDEASYPLLQIGDTATVLENSPSPFVVMDKDINGHDCGGLCKNGYGKCLSEDQLELIQPTKTITLILGNTAYEITGENITIKTKQL